MISKSISSKQPNKKKQHPTARGLATGVALFCFMLLLILWLSPKPSLFSWQTWSTAYVDRNGELLRLTLADDDKYRLKTDLTDVSPHLVKAALLYEDQYFYDHPGVHLPALWRAFWSTYVLKERQIGASTITMQLARIAFDIDSSTIPGKLQQIAAALWIERHYTKEQILTAYLNRVPYGGNIEGISAASLIYFQKKPAQLNPAEAMALAVIPQNPSKRNPVTASGYQAMIEARQRIYARWHQAQSGSDDSLARSTNSDTLQLWMNMPLQIHTTKDLPFQAPHFIEHLRKTQPNLRNEVQTTLNVQSQNSIQKWVNLWLEEQSELQLNNAGALLINHKTMEIEAWLGSANFFDNAIEGQVDIVTAKRSPGSTLKPFVYGLALQQGVIHPKTLLKDTPSRYAAYTPENYDLAYAGPISATDALITSRNVPAVRLTAKLKSPDLYQFLTEAQITKVKAKSHYGLSLALGGMEITMLEMAKLYAILANQGLWQPAKSLLTLPSSKTSSKTHSSSNETISSRQLMSPESAWLIENMLQQNPAPDSLNSDHVKTLTQQPNIAWKTGTSFAFRDAWSAGFDEDHVLVIWLGHFNSESNPNLIGRSAAGPLFFDVFRDLQTGSESFFQPVRSKPDNIKQVDICASTGALPGRFCPRTEKGWFIPGVSPIKVSDVYRQIPIVTATGKRACYPQANKTHMAVYEFWPSDVLRLFQMAGIQRKQPPAFAEPCDIEDLSTGGAKPIIRSPLNRLIYQIANGQDEIPFQAILDTDVETTYWFLNQSFIGSATKNTPLFWKAKPGHYQITVVDDKGLSDSLEFEVRKIN